MPENTPNEQPDPNTAQVRLDDSQVETSYANFCRISGTPEELVLDFALNPQSTGRLPEVLKINQRVIMNFYTAKRLLGALHQAVHRHEQAFGMLEIDFRKRVAATQTETKG
jgi:hypothetical protein